MVDPLTIGKAIFYAGAGIASFASAFKDETHTYSTTTENIDPKTLEESKQYKEEAENSNKRCEEIQRNYNSACLELDSVNRKKDYLTNENQNLKMKVNHMENETAEREEKHKRDKEKLYNEINEQGNEIRELKETSRNQLKENEELRGKIEVLNNENIRVNNEIIEVKNELKNKERESQLLQEEVRQEKRKVERLEIDNEKNKVEKEKLSKEKNQLKIESEKKDKTINLLNKNNAELKEEIKKEELIKKEKERKGREARNKFEKKTIEKRDTIIEEKKKEISKELEEFSKEFIIPEDSINILLKKVIKSQLKKLEEKYSKILEDYQFNGDELKHFNILICGLNGAGKSTLINSLLGKKVAKTGIGESQTKKTDPYESENLKGYRFYDTAGLNSQHNLKVALKVINTCIQENINNLDKAIHCIWYCTSHNRFNKEEFTEFLFKLMSNYEKKIPLIIVYTQSWDEEVTEEMKIKINQILKDGKDMIGYEENVEIIDIIALEKKINNQIFPQKNLDLLLEKTNGKIIEATQSTCYELLKGYIKSHYNKRISDVYEKIKEQVNTKIKNYILKISGNLTYDEMFSIVDKIFYEICSNFFEKTFDIKEVDFEVKTFFEDLRLKSEEKVEDFISKKTEKIASEISIQLNSLQVSIDKEFGENMKNKKETNDFIRENKDFIKTSISNFVEKTYLKYYMEKLFDKITDLFNKNLVDNFEVILRKRLSKKIENISISTMNSFCIKLRENIQKTKSIWERSIEKKLKEDEKKLKEMKAKIEEENDNFYY